MLRQIGKCNVQFSAIEKQISVSTYIVGQHGCVRDAGKKIMADTGALRSPAVAGYAGAIVEHVGDLQLHVGVHPRESASKQTQLVAL